MSSLRTMLSEYEAELDREPVTESRAPTEPYNEWIERNGTAFESELDAREYYFRSGGASASNLMPRPSPRPTLADRIKNASKKLVVHPAINIAASIPDAAAEAGELIGRSIAQIQPGTVAQTALFPGRDSVLRRSGLAMPVEDSRTEAIRAMLGAEPEDVAPVRQRIERQIQELRGPTRIVEQSADAIRSAAQTVREQAERVAPTDPRLQGDFWWDQMPSAIGSFGSFIAAVMIFRGLGGSGGAAAAGLAGAGGVSEARQRVQPFVENGTVSPEQANQIATLGVGPGLIQVFPVMRAIERAFPPAGQIVKNRFGQWLANGATGAVEESIVEGLGAVGQNAIERYFVNGERELIDGVMEQSAAGGGAGFVANFILSALGARRAGRIPENATPEQVYKAATEQMQAAERRLPVEPEDYVIPQENINAETLQAEVQSEATPEAGQAEADAPTAETGQVEAAPEAGEVISGAPETPTVIEREQARLTEVPPPDATDQPNGTIRIGPRGDENITRAALADLPQPALRDLAESMGIDANQDRPDLVQAVMDTRPNQIETLYSGFAPPMIVTGAAKETGSGFWNNFMSDMIDRLSRSSEEPAIKEAASAARQAVSDAQGIAGELSAELNHIHDLAGDSPITRRGRAVVNLQRLVPRAEGSADSVSLFHLALENKLPADATLSQQEQEIVDAIKGLLRKTGEMNEREGTLRYNHRTEEWEPFVTPERDVAPRLSSPYLIHTIISGESNPLWNPLVDAIAEGNSVDRKEVIRVLKANRSDLVGDQQPESTFRRINAELMREWNYFPTHIRNPTTGFTVELITSNPYDYATRHVEVTASRLGYTRNFGQETTEGSLSRRLAEQLKEKSGDARPLIDVTRALNGMPVDPRFWTDPGSNTAMLALGAQHIMRVAASGALSQTWVPNATEPLGVIQTMAGGRFGEDFWSALWRLVPFTERRQVTQAALEELGSISLWLRNLSWNPQKPGESAARIFSEAGVLAPRIFWRSQERFAAAIALSKSERMQQGRGTAGDVVDVMAMLGYSRDQARAMARGEGTPEQYLALSRRGGAFTTNSPMRSAEQSRIEHNAVFRMAFRFTRYAMMRLRWMGKMFPQAVEATNHWRNNRSTDPKAFGEMLASYTKIARGVAGTTASGTLAHFLMAFAVGGPLGLRLAWEEAKEKPEKFLFDSFMYTMFAGPLGAVLRNTRDPGRPWYEQAVAYTWPGVIAIELTNLITGSGKYEGRNFWWEPEGNGRLRMFTGRFVPIGKTGTTMLALFGFQQDRHELDTAIRSYWRARRDIEPIMVRSVGASSDPDVAEQQRQHREFRSQMRRAYEAITNGNDPYDYIIEALQTDTKKSSDVAQYLRNKKLLRGKYGQPGTPQYEALYSRLGEEGIGIIQGHDLLLEQWARSFSRR